MTSSLRTCDGTSTCLSPVLPRRALFLTLEYKAGTFSGNGIYSQSMVRALTKLGHSVFVISGGPRDVVGEGAPDSRQDVEAGLEEIGVPGWGRLNWECGWREFAAGVTAEVAKRVAAFRPEWALVVDWSAMGVYDALAAHTVAWEAAGWDLPPMSYLNYRVYTLSEYKGERAGEERTFYWDKEGEAVRRAWAISALSSRDAAFLDDLGAGKRAPGAPRARALLPPLREDIRQRAVSAALRREGRGTAGEEARVWRQGRRYLACCVRLSPEKNADLFAGVLERLGAAELEERGVVPLLCAGASSSDRYARTVKQRVRAAVPAAEVVEGFLGPEKLGVLYSRTLLNLHPCLYDAYGMTMVEAAAFGAPSVVNVGSSGAVGASELLVPEQGLAIPLDLTLDLDTLALRVKELLDDTAKLAAVGQAAAKASLSWSEAANARELTCIVEDAVSLQQQTE